MTGFSARKLTRAALEDLRYDGGRRIRRWTRVRARRAYDRSVKLLEGRRDVVYPIAFGQHGTGLVDAVRSRAGTAGLRLMFGGDPGSSSRTVHVECDQLSTFLRLVSDVATSDVLVRLPGDPDALLDERLITRLSKLGRSFELLVVERDAGVEPVHRWSSRIVVAVWMQRTGAYAVDYFESEPEFPSVGRLSPQLIRQLGSELHDFDDDARGTSQPQFPIDVVYTWVDGDDPRWEDEKRRYADAAGRELPRRVVHDERFRSREELRYSLRSLEIFAPWVRRVFIVTADQTPTWLDTSHPKITMVSHRDIYANHAWLPTFNSSGIETQLHHIDGLARHFLYFNDDFLLGQLTDPGDFFWSNGMLKFFPSEQRVYVDDVDGRSEEYIRADKNAIELFEPIMVEVGRSIMRHVPYPSDREILWEMEERWPHAFAACASARFRSGADIRPIAFMQYHYGYSTRRAVPASITHRYLALWKPSILDQLASTASSRAYRTICINDVGVEPSRVWEINAGVEAFLETYFPAASSFELDA